MRTKEEAWSPWGRGTAEMEQLGKHLGPVFVDGIHQNSVARDGRSVPCDQVVPGRTGRGMGPYTLQDDQPYTAAGALGMICDHPVGGPIVLTQVRLVGAADDAIAYFEIADLDR